MDCLILAGGTPNKNDPLKPYLHKKPKALLTLNGRFMIEYVIQALQKATTVDNILIVGIDQKEYDLTGPNIFQIPDEGSIVENGLAGLAWLDKHRGGSSFTLICGCDIPLITGEMIDQVVFNCEPLIQMIYYHLVTEKVMLTKYPKAGRTFVSLKNMRVAGGDLLIVHSSLASQNQALWHALTSGRKHAWKLARIVGLRFLIKFVFHQISIGEIEATARQIIKHPVKIVLTPFAEIGMDVDKPEHIFLVQATLQK